MPSLINTLPDDTTQKELSRHLSLKGTRRYVSECVRRYMHIIINFHSKECKQLTQSICVHGKSVCLTSLTTEDASLLANFQRMPTNDCSMSQYFKVHITTSNRIITSNSSYRGRLRDNSGVVYVKSDVRHYGRLEKVLVFDALGYAIVQVLSSFCNKLCNDLVTNCGLNDHIVSLKATQ